MFNKLTLSLSIILLISLVVNALTVREIIKYEPAKYKFRFYNNFKQKGWLDKSFGVEKLSADSTAYIMTLGQSNSANSSNALDTASTNAYSYYNGQLYRAQDPMIGCSGDGGSVWPVLADKIILAKKYKKVVIIPIAVGSREAEVC